MEQQHYHEEVECGAIVVIRHPQKRHQSCKNSLIRWKAVHHNYSDGEVHGIAGVDEIQIREGYWPGDRGLSILTFDNYEDAVRWTHSTPDIKQHDWLDGVDMVVVRCCKHNSICHDVVQVMDLDITDHDMLSCAYSPAAKDLLDKHNARQIVSCNVRDPNQGMKIRGQWDPGYLIINTWESIDCYNQAFNGEENKDILPSRALSARTTSIIATMEPLCC